MDKLKEAIKGNCWHWTGDPKDDNLETIANDCVVLITGQQLRDLLSVSLPAQPDQKIDQPACPYCGAQPLRFNMQQGPVPTGQPDGSQLLIAQTWCSSCKRQFAMQIMGVIPGQPQPADDLAGQKKPKLWSPS